MDAPILLTQPLVNFVSTRGIGSVLNTTGWSIMQSRELLGEDGQQVVRAGVHPLHRVHPCYDRRHGEQGCSHQQQVEVVEVFQRCQ